MAQTPIASRVCLARAPVAMDRDAGRPGSASDNDDCTDCSSACDDIKLSRSSSSSCGGSASELTTVTLTTDVVDVDVSGAAASANTPTFGVSASGDNIQHHQQQSQRLTKLTVDRVHADVVPAVLILSGTATLEDGIHADGNTEPDDVLSESSSSATTSTVPAVSNVDEASTAALAAQTMAAALPQHCSTAGNGTAPQVQVPAPSVTLPLPQQKHPNLLYHYLRLIFQHCKVNIDYSQVHV